MIYWAVLLSNSCLNIYVFPRTFYEDTRTFKSSFLSTLLHGNTLLLCSQPPPCATAGVQV